VRLPITGTLLIPVGKPERGDIIVFRYPDDPSQDFIKRVVGLPGDRVEMRENRLWLNGQLVDLIPDGKFAYAEGFQRGDLARYTERNPESREYTVLYAQRPSQAPAWREREGPWMVPEGQYFAMGDNRDNSQDSRRWKHSFVRADQIKGRAFRIHWSWVIDAGPADRGFVMDLLNTLWQVITFQVEEIRWSRIGRSLDGIAAGSGDGASPRVSD
jgi:signal peptidase I